jgi:tRNA-splicing ligase RtcB
MIEFGLDGRVPIKAWAERAEDLEPSCIDQAKDVANLPCVVSHVALMPDTHQGYGMPIGGVAALKGALSPYMVGVDIGCGMMAVKTYIEAGQFRQERERILNEVMAAVPMGVGGTRDKAVRSDNERMFDFIDEDEMDVIHRQIGTLGSGNHFIEFGSDGDGVLWFVIHSGSRRLGQKVANHHHQVAVRQCQELGITLPTEHLAFLTEGTDEFERYRQDLGYALKYAQENRAAMAQDILRILGNPNTRTVNVHHNFATIEHHFGEWVWVHRKGATRAACGGSLVIPMNMGDGVVIGTGLGNPESFDSCSHGAGRLMGRNQAKKRLDRVAEEQSLVDRDILLMSNGDVLDEMPGAYKNAEYVMRMQEDLVQVDHWLRPIAVLKG